VVVFRFQGECCRAGSRYLYDYDFISKLHAAEGQVAKYQGLKLRSTRDMVFCMVFTFWLPSISNRASLRYLPGVQLFLGLPPRALEPMIEEGSG
jgi:hypothetical protein